MLSSENLFAATASLIRILREFGLDSSSGFSMSGSDCHNWPTCFGLPSSSTLRLVSSGDNPSVSTSCTLALSSILRSAYSLAVLPESGLRSSGLPSGYISCVFGSTTILPTLGRLLSSPSSFFTAFSSGFTGAGSVFGLTGASRPSGDSNADLRLPINPTASSFIFFLAD